MIKKIMLAGVLLLALVGCTVGLPIINPGSVETYPLDRYFEWLGTANIEELILQQERITQSQQEEMTLTEIVQLALILSISTLGDQQTGFEAAELIDLLDNREAENSQEQEYLEFAVIWKRLLEQTRNTQQISQRETALEVLEALEQEIEVLTEENRRLQQQIDALTTIERQLIEREQ